MMSLNFWPHLKWSGSWNRWSSCIPSNGNCLSSSSHIIPHPGGKQRVSKLNPNLFSVLKKRWQKSNIKCCSDVWLYYADQSINLIFQCDKYNIIVSLVTAGRNGNIYLHFYFQRYLCYVLVFSQDRVNLLHISYCGGMFWICASKKGVDNTGISSSFAEQKLHWEEAFSATM